jgi:hypothetical protein
MRSCRSIRSCAGTGERRGGRGCETGGGDEELQDGLAVLDAEALVEVGVEGLLREVLDGGGPRGARPHHGHEVRDDRRRCDGIEGVYAGLLEVDGAEGLENGRRAEVRRVGAALEVPIGA